MIDVDVFFDMTGTITDMRSENLAFVKMCEELVEEFKIGMSAEVLAAKIKEYRKPFMERRAERYIPIRILIADALESIMGKDLTEEEREKVYRIYEDSHAKYVKLQGGAKDALYKIRGVVDVMGMVTDADRPYTIKVLRSLGIGELFDCVITAEDAGVGKPNPKIFSMAQNCGRSNPKVFVGDSERRDIVGAKQMGFIAIKIGNRTEHGDHLASDLMDAARIIAQILL